MRFFLTIIWFLISWISSAQVDSAGLKNAMQRLDKALLQKDSAELSVLFHDKLSFGHSNGWTQAKTDVWNDFASGKLAYKKIENSNSTIAAIDKKWATVRMNVVAEGRVSDKEFVLNLHVLQVWTKTKKGWKLLARQSAKIN